MHLYRLNIAKRLAEEIAKKIQEIDEMSLSEYELLAEDEKEFYLKSTLPIKKQQAVFRRMQFAERMLELRKRKVLYSICNSYTLSGIIDNAMKYYR